MATLNDRLKALEYRMTEAERNKPKFMEIVNGKRTEAQQIEYENAIANGMDIFTISIVSV